jgi:hypothetical protein
MRGADFVQFDFMKIASKTDFSPEIPRSFSKHRPVDEGEYRAETSKTASRRAAERAVFERSEKASHLWVLQPIDMPPVRPTSNMYGL